MRQTLLIVVAFLCSACGSAPDAPSVMGLAAASAITVICASRTSLDCQDFSFQIINYGPACVPTADLAGSVSVSLPIQTSANWTLTTADQASGAFKPWQVKTATRSAGSLPNPIPPVLFPSPGGYFPGTYQITNFTMNITEKTGVLCP